MFPSDNHQIKFAGIDKAFSSLEELIFCLTVALIMVGLAALDKDIELLHCFQVSSRETPDMQVLRQENIVHMWFLLYY